MKEKEVDMFKTLNIQINQVINTEKERHIFLKNNQPLTIVLEEGQKYYLNIKIYQQNPPLRMFFKPKMKGNFTVYASRKNNKPFMDDKIYSNPYKIQIKGHHDEGVFLTEAAYFTIVADRKMRITMGY